jgi:hypothetical protein
MVRLLIVDVSAVERGVAFEWELAQGVQLLLAVAS